MALDVAMTLNSVPADVLIKTDLVPGLTRVFGGRVALFAQNAVHGDQIQLEENGESRYETLEAAGVVAIQVAQWSDSPGKVLLSGGSICEVELMLPKDGRSWVIRKSVRAPAHSIADEDGLARHQSEAAWLVEQTARGHRLFPDAVLVSLDGVRVAWEMEFIPRYTLGERLIQGRETSESVLNILDLALEALEADVYSQTSSAHQQSYLLKVKRRFEGLSELSSVYRAIWSNGFKLNGSTVESVQSLLLRAAEKFPILADPPAGRLCHGDLIFEDILPSGTNTDAPVRFVDPNPQNVSPFFDVGKLFMNVLGAYDVIYRDLLVLNVDGSNEISLSLGMRACLDIYYGVTAGLLERFDYLEDLVGIQFGSQAIMAQAALHLLALPAFHEHVHEKRDRSIAFAAIGASLLSAALHGRDPIDWIGQWTE